MPQQRIGQVIRLERLAEIGIIKKMFWLQQNHIRRVNKELESDIKHQNGEKSYFRNKVKRKRACIVELIDVKNRIDKKIDEIESMLKKKKKKRKGRKVYWWYF